MRLEVNVAKWRITHEFIFYCITVEFISMFNHLQSGFPVWILEKFKSSWFNYCILNIIFLKSNKRPSLLWDKMWTPYDFGEKFSGKSEKYLPVSASWLVKVDIALKMKLSEPCPQKIDNAIILFCYWYFVWLQVLMLPCYFCSSRYRAISIRRSVALKPILLCWSSMNSTIDQKLCPTSSYISDNICKIGLNQKPK